MSSVCTDLIRNAKLSYIKKSNVLSDKRTDSKVYWLKNFLNNIKIPSVPSMLMSGATIINIIEKANTFNEFFASQCTLLENNSKLHSLLMNTDKRLNTVSIKKDDITAIINSSHPTIAHGFDNISIRIIQLCGDFITLPIFEILKSRLSKVFFLIHRKRPT